MRSASPFDTNPLPYTPANPSNWGRGPGDPPADCRAALDQLSALLVPGTFNPAAAQQATWFVDGQNSTGLASDSNSGLLATAPLRTDRQRAARVGATPVLGNMTVTLLSVQAAGDYITEPFVGIDGFFLVTGSPGAVPLHAGTLSAQTAHAGNNPQYLTDAATTWTTAGPAGSSLIGYRLRVTAGLNAGTCVMLGASPSAHVAIGSDPELVTTLSTQFQLTSKVLVGNESYVVESLPLVNAIVQPYGYVSGTNAAGSGVRFMYEGIAFPTTAAPGVGQPATAPRVTSYFDRMFVSCLVGAVLDRGYYMGCMSYLGPSLFPEFPAGAETVMLGCLLVGSGGGFVAISPGAAVTMDQNTLWYGQAISVEGYLGIGLNDSGAFLGIGAGGCGSGADAIDVQPGGTLAIGPTTFLWGGGAGAGAANVGYGIRALSGGQGNYQTKADMTITGTTGDTLIGGTAKAYAAIPFINPANNAMLVALA